MLKFSRSSLRHSARSLLVSAAPTSQPFLLFSSYLTPALSSPPFFLLPQSLWQELSSLSSCSIRLQWVPGHSFLPGNDTADDLARRGALLAPSPIHSCFFSDWRRTVLSKLFDTQVPSISTEELVLLRHARCVLSRLHCNGHRLLLSYLSRIGTIENPSCSVADTRPRTPLISFCSLQLHTLCAACSLATFWRVARFLGLDGLPPCPHPSEGIG